VVADRADESFSFDLNRLRSPEGRIVRGKIVVHALTHPQVISDLLRLKRRTKNAAEALGNFLVGSRVIANTASPAPES
jgi:hypothetical protein